MLGGNKTSPTNNVNRDYMGSMVMYPNLMVTKNYSLSIVRWCQKKPMESQNFHHCPAVRRPQWVQKGGTLPLPAREVSVGIEQDK